MVEEKQHQFLQNKPLETTLTSNMGLCIQCTCGQLLQLCLTLCDPMDCGPPGSSVHGILQARILKRVAMPSSGGSSPPRHQTHVSYVSCISRGVLYCSCPLGRANMSTTTQRRKNLMLNLASLLQNRIKLQRQNFE